ncbi:hypothetical protein GCM10009565_53880 [Amycolatopsis albidoflavus]
MSGVVAEANAAFQSGNVAAAADAPRNARREIKENRLLESCPFPVTGTLATAGRRGQRMRGNWPVLSFPENAADAH